MSRAQEDLIKDFRRVMEHHDLKADKVAESFIDAFEEHFADERDTDNYYHALFQFETFANESEDEEE